MDAQEINTHSENVFVYGTLKKDECNHPVMEAAGGIFLGSSTIKGKYNDTYWGYPCLTPGTDDIPGEIYAVPPTGLVKLDRFEGTPRLFRREKTTCSSGLEVWVYMGEGAKRGITRQAKPLS